MVLLALVGTAIFSLGGCLMASWQNGHSAKEDARGAGLLLMIVGAVIFILCAKSSPGSCTTIGRC